MSNCLSKSDLATGGVYIYRDTISRLPLSVSSNCISDRLLLFVSGTTNQTNTAANRQNALHIMKRPYISTSFSTSLDKYVTVNTKIQLVAVARLVPYGFI